MNNKKKELLPICKNLLGDQLQRAVVGILNRCLLCVVCSFVHASIDSCDIEFFLLLFEKKCDCGFVPRL